MALNLGELFYKISISGVSAVTGGLDDVAKASGVAVAAQSRLDGVLGKSSASLSNFGDEARLVAAGIGALGASLAGLTSFNLAAKYQNVEIGLTNILGSAEKAKKLVGELITLGGQTPFDTSELVGFSRGLLATGSTAESVTRELKVLSAVGANMGLPVGEVGELARLLGDVRNRAHAGAETFQALQSRGVNLAKVLAASGGPKFEGQFGGLQASQYLGSLPGAKAFDVVMKGLEKLNPEPAQSVLSTLQNLGESFQNVMLPTGRLLLPVVGGIAQALKFVADGFGKINELTGGSGGLILILGGLWKAKNLLIGSTLTAISAIQNLSATLNKLSLSAGISAGATGSAGIAGGLGAGISGVKGFFSGGVKGILPALGGALKAVKGPGLGFAVDILGNLLGDKLGGQAGNLIKNISTGVGLGALAGPWGALVGGLGGLGAGLWQNSQTKPSDPATKTAENTKRMADSLEALNGRLLGQGGRRAGASISEIEAEQALARALMLA